MVPSEEARDLCRCNLHMRMFARFTHIYICRYTHVDILIYMCVYACIDIYIYIHIHMQSPVGVQSELQTFSVFPVDFVTDFEAAQLRKKHVMRAWRMFWIKKKNSVCIFVNSF